MSHFTPIASRLSIALDDEYRRMQNEWFFKWHFIGERGPVEIDSFDGRTINYGGIKFSGTARNVYWQTIQRYLRKKIGSIFDEIEAELAKYPLEVRDATLRQCDSLAREFTGKIRKAAVEKDRILRGDGMNFPQAHDAGTWSGSTGSDIEARVASLAYIYCDRTFIVEGKEMSLNAFQSMMNDKLTLLKTDGTIAREDIKGKVSENLIVTFVKDLPIQVGDHFLRHLPSGLVDDFVVLDPGFHSGMHGMAAHFQTRVRRSDVPTSLERAVIQNIVTQHFHGPNARANTNSTDNSINIAGDISLHEVSNLLSQLRPAVASLPSPHKEALQAPLAILEEEIRSATPSQPRLRSALQSMKTIAEGAVGNLTAAGIGALIGQMLS